MTIATHVADPPTPSSDEAPELPPWDIVEEWGRGSFPASDPPANW